jgi:spore coat polysaccharide biosynthesis protein SpsF
MKVACVIQARLRSTRLPGKILLPLPSGRTVLEEVVYRCREARRVHQVIVAIPETEECDLLLPYTGGACVVRGPEDDVLERYRRAASYAGADIVVRVTSDCPLIPSEMIDEVIAQRNVHALNYCANNIPERTWPHGYDCEVFTARSLYWHAENTWDASSREHVTTSMRRKVEGADHINVPCPDGDFSHLRWTLDTIDDYVRICRVFEGARGASNLLEVVKQ